MAGKPVGTLETLLLVILIVFWGSSFVVVKMALAQGLTPVSIATFRFLLAGGLFALTLLLKRMHKSRDRALIEIKDLHACACGGTHVKNIKEIGAVKVLRREAKGKGVQRIEFVAKNP